MSTASIREPIICFLPPAGTPNSAFPPDLENKIPRERIYLPAQDGQTCFFGAMDRIRLIMGDHPSVAGDEMRQKEIVLLKSRGPFNAIVTQNIQDQQLTALLQSLLKTAEITREVAESIIQENENNPNLENPEFLDRLREFAKQEEIEELSEFLSQKYLERITDYTKQLMKEVVGNPEEDPQTDLEIDSAVDAFREGGFSTDEIALYVEELKNIPLYSQAGLEESQWNPSQSISSLNQEIIKNGPLLVIGQFGKSFYDEAPFELSAKIRTKSGDDVYERSLWGWPPNSARNDASTRRHAVLIVGASEEKKHIYYIDPLDPSDPNDPESQKIYVMSEARFLKGLCPIVGLQVKDEETGEVIFDDPENSYALHGNPDLFRL